MHRTVVFFTALFLALCVAASAAQAARVTLSARPLLQPTPQAPSAEPETSPGASSDQADQDPDAVAIAGLKKIQAGDESERADAVNLLYVLIGCRGQYDRDPDVVAQNLSDNFSANPKYIDAGVVDTQLEVIQEALTKVQTEGPPAPKDCPAYTAVGAAYSGR